MLVPEFYVIVDKYVTRLILYDIPKNIKVFLENDIIRKAIKNVIDILYINDQWLGNVVTCTPGNETAQSSQVDEISDSRESLILHSLAYIIKPKFLYGIYNKNPLPHYITVCRAKPNINYAEKN